MINNFTSPIKEATNSYGNFEEKMNKVSMIADTSVKSIKNLSDGVLEISNNTGESSSILAESLYKIISATKDTGNALEYLNIASKISKGGFTDIETAVNGITSVMNKYGVHSKDNMQKVADLMLKTQNLGKISFGDLVKSLDNVVPTAARVNIGFDQIGAAMATITSKGVKTNTAAVQLQKLLKELSKDGSKAAKTFKELSGKTFSDFIKNGGTMQGALNIMGMAAKKNGKSINGLFESVDAGNAAMQLTGTNSKRFANNLKSMENAAGSVDNAYKKMKSGFKASINELSNSIKNMVITIAQYMVPAISKITKIIQNIINKFNKLSPITKKIVAEIALFVMAVGPISSVLGKIGKAINGVLTGFELLKKGIRIFSLLPGLLNPPVLITVGIIAAIGLVVYEVIKHWSKLKQAAKNLFNAICSICKKISQSFSNAISGWINLWNEFCIFMSKIGTSIMNGLLDGIRNGWNTVKNVVSRIATGIGDVFKKILGINSPSRVFKEYGCFIGEGLVEGIDGQESAIDSKFKRLGDKIRGLGNVKPYLGDLGLNDIAISGGYSDMGFKNLGLNNNVGITQDIKMYISIPNGYSEGVQQLSNEFKTMSQNALKNSMVDLFMNDALRN